jgi:mannosyltransferase OCH1-like enzyme
MRRGVALFLLINFLILGYILNSVFTLITLLFEDCKADAILSSEIPAPGSELIGKGPQYIPRIIHQTWANDSIPEKWRKAQKSCLDLHGDYEYKVRCERRSGLGARRNDGGELFLRSSGVLR